MQPSDDAYEQELDVLKLSMPDDKFMQSVTQSYSKSKTHWDKAPFNFDKLDELALPYIYNQFQKQDGFFQTDDDNQYIDNRLFRGARSIRAYVTSSLAKPDLTPGQMDEYSKREARMIAMALYQHTLDDDVDEKAAQVFLNHYFRKRGYLKLRWDKWAGVSGDILTEVVSPEKLVIDRFARYKGNPPQIHHEVTCSLDELCASFPKQANAIYSAFGIKKGVFTQLSREVTYYETWFSYLDKDYYPREGVGWWLSNPSELMLDKEPNPNWIYSGDDAEDKQINLMSRPPKPFVGINYLNLGKSFIDETCVFEHALPQQKLLDYRTGQWNQNIDYVNGRWLANKNRLSEEEANGMVRKGPKTIGMVDLKQGETLDGVLKAVAAGSLGPEVYQSLLDARNEVDDLAGVNAVFKGATPQKKETLGRDILVNQNATSLQDDYVRAIAKMMKSYYQIKLQMGKVYWTENQTIATKDRTGKDIAITLNGSMIDENMKVRIGADSIFPISKQQKRQDASELFGAGKLDPKSAFEDMGYVDADERAVRTMKFVNDPTGYADGLELSMDNFEAEEDIQELIKGGEPKERDTYDQDYLDYYDLFMTTGRFMKLEPEVKQRVTAFLALTQHIAATQLGLRSAMLNAAGVIEPPPMPPVQPTLTSGGAPASTAGLKVPGSQVAAPNPLPPSVVQ